MIGIKMREECNAIYYKKEKDLKYLSWLLLCWLEESPKSPSEKHMTMDKILLQDMCVASMI